MPYVRPHTGCRRSVHIRGASTDNFEQSGKRVSRIESSCTDMSGTATLFNKDRKHRLTNLRKDGEAGTEANRGRIAELRALANEAARKPGFGQLVGR
jgi:hypothetical protein